MKKLLAIVICLVMIIGVTACGNENNNSSKSNKKSAGSETLTCVKTEVDEDGNKTEEKVVVKTKKGIVQKVNQTTIMETESEYIEMSLTMFEGFVAKFNEVKGITMKAEKQGENVIKQEIEIDYNKLDIAAIKKVVEELFGDLAKDSDSLLTSFEKDQLTFENFQAENLEGYTCN